MSRALPMMALALGLAACAYAQVSAEPAKVPPPRGFGSYGSTNANTSMEVTPAGIFVLKNGVLAKYDAALKPTGALELFGALSPYPALPENPSPQDQDAMRAWIKQFSARTAPAAMLYKEDVLYVVVGATYFRVNAKTLTQELKANLDEDGANPVLAVPSSNVPFLKLEDGMLYLLSGTEFLAIRAQDGTVQNRAALPQEMFPTPRAAKSPRELQRNP